MSNMVREWLKILCLLPQTTHEDRVAIDREIEWVTGVDCDEALKQKMLTLEEFEELVKRVLEARKEKQEFKEQIQKLFEKDREKEKKRDKSEEEFTGPPDRFLEQHKKAKEIWKVA